MMVGAYNIFNVGILILADQDSIDALLERLPNEAHAGGFVRISR